MALNVQSWCRWLTHAIDPGCSASSTHPFSQQGRESSEPSNPIRASKNSIRQTRFLALLLVALVTMSPAWADVLYVKPDSIAAIHDLLPKDSAGKTPPGVEEATVSGDYVIRGRIVGWFPGDPNLPYSAISEDRQAMPPVGWGGPVIRFRVGLGHSGSGGTDGASQPGPTTSKPVVLTIGMFEFGQITHELDHFQDLRWMLSNRDQVLACLLGIRRDQVSWGQPKIDAYLRYELGLEQESRLPWGTLSQLKSRTAAGGPSVPLREGWLIRWLNDGPPASPTEHRGELQEALYNRREAFHPLIMKRTNIKSTVHELLRAAARDYRYGGIYHGGTPERPNFYVACVAVVSHLCDMAEVEPTNPRRKRIREAGLQARQALIEALESAQVGRLSLIDLDNEAVVARALPENPAARERMLAHLRNIQRPKVKSLAGLLPQPIQPSTVAMVALKVIEGSSSWRRYLTEPATGNPVDAERLVRALVALFREGDENVPRMSDWVRTTPDKTPWNPDLGHISVMRRQVMNATGIGPDASGILTGADRVRFLIHFARLLTERDENERLFAGKALATAGPADLETMQNLVGGLFAAAIGEIYKQETIEGSLSASERAEREKRNLRRRQAARLREDATATLARLAVLWGSDEEKSTRDMVLDRLDGLYDAHSEGWAGKSVRQFVDELRTLATTVAPLPSSGRFEEQRRRNYQRDVSRLLEMHRDRATRAHQQAVASGDRLKENRARRVLNVILNIQKGNAPP